MDEDHDERRLKINLAAAISMRTDDLLLDDASAALRAGVDDPRLFSRIDRGELDWIGAYEMMRMLAALGVHVVVSLRPTTTERAAVYMDDPHLRS